MNTMSARQHRHRRVRSRIVGTADRPRLAVFRSLKHISAQLIDDDANRTIVMASESQLTTKGGTKSARAKSVGTLLAERAIAKKITTVVFDRGGYKFHGRVQALAEGARAGGLKF